jgi:hypothetical protein
MRRENEEEEKERETNERRERLVRKLKRNGSLDPDALANALAANGSAPLGGKGSPLTTVDDNARLAAMLERVVAEKDTASRLLAGPDLDIGEDNASDEDDGSDSDSENAPAKNARTQMAASGKLQRLPPSRRSALPSVGTANMPKGGNGPNTNGGKGTTIRKPSLAPTNPDSDAVHEKTISRINQWRERLAADVDPSTSSAFESDPIANPSPTISSSVDSSFKTTSRLTSADWMAIVDCLALINDSTGCQASLNGSPPLNVWIVKPAGKSRGRGIACERRLDKILRLSGGAEHKEASWVCQKYIERPLLIHGFKWDIRQWVLVSSWSPLTIWIFDRPYLRFCCYPFELGNLSNRFVHLSNNSIQKHSVAFDASTIEGNMWHAKAFSAWLQERAADGQWDGLVYEPDEPAQRGDCGVLPPGIVLQPPPGYVSIQSDGTPSVPSNQEAAAFDDAEQANTAPRPTGVRPVSNSKDIWSDVLLPQIRRIVSWSLQAAQESVEARNKSFEIYGFDFMVDEDLRTWLIEINSSPDFSYSTKVTKDLVVEASEDAMKVVVEHSAWADKCEALQRAAERKVKRGMAVDGKTAIGRAQTAPMQIGSTSTQPSFAIDLPEAPETGGWRCIFKSPVVASRNVLTCAAHDIFCMGRNIPAPAHAVAQIAAAKRATNVLFSPEKSKAATLTMRPPRFASKMASLSSQPADAPHHVVKPIQKVRAVLPTASVTLDLMPAIPHQRRSMSAVPASR